MDDACKSKGTRWDDACKSKGTKWDDVCKSIKEQDGMMIAKVKVPSIPTSAVCCYDVQLTNVKCSSYTFYNRQLLNQTASSKPQIPLVIYNCQLIHRTASSKHRYL